MGIARWGEEIREALEAHGDPSYEAGMRRTVPSEQPAHAVRVPEIRRIGNLWRQNHKDVVPADVLRLAEALWATEWREERCLAIQLVGENKVLIATLPWEVVERWSSEIDNWEHVDHLAPGIAAPLLRQRPERIDDVERLAGSEHSWQRRLAIVTLIDATRKDARWAPRLEAMTDRLQGDRGPTLRRAVAWARKTLRDVEEKRVG